MKLEDVEKLEKIMGQLEGLHKELSALARKSPNDALNEFKLRFVNIAISDANDLLGESYRPFADFTKFEEDDLPSNSDVTMILGQYIEEVERKRADNLTRNAGYWIYILDDSNQQIKTAPPKKLNEKK